MKMLGIHIQTRAALIDRIDQVVLQTNTKIPMSSEEEPLLTAHEPYWRGYGRFVS